MTRSADEVWTTVLAEMDALHVGFLPPGGFTAEVEAMPEQTRALLKITAATAWRMATDEAADRAIERAARHG